MSRGVARVDLIWCGVTLMCHPSNKLIAFFRFEGQMSTPCGVSSCALGTPHTPLTTPLHHDYYIHMDLRSPPSYHSVTLHKCNRHSNHFNNSECHTPISVSSDAVRTLRTPLATPLSYLTVLNFLPIYGPGTSLRCSIT